MVDCLGVDIGGVIIDRVRGDNSDTSMFSDRYLETPEVKNAISAIAHLNEGVFHGRVVIVSKAGDTMRRKSMAWLKAHDFFKKVNIPENHIEFTYSRHEKAGICGQWGVTHFVDDKCEVLYHLAGIVKNLYLFQGGERGQQEYPTIWNQLKRVESWTDILNEFFGDEP